MNHKNQEQLSEFRWAMQMGRPAFLLAGIAGGVDAIGFLFLGHLFTAHMSGNTAGAGAYIGQGDWTEALRRLAPLPPFVMGVFAASLLYERMKDVGRKPPFVLLYAIELLLLLAFWAVGALALHPGVPSNDVRTLAIAILPSFAMGIQNASLRRISGESVRTTYITGMLTNLGEEIGAWTYRRLKREGHRRVDKLSGLWTGIWLLYLFGAAFCAWASTLIGLAALSLPAIGLVALIIIELR